MTGPQAIPQIWLYNSGPNIYQPVLAFQSPEVLPELLGFDLGTYLEGKFLGRSIKIQRDGSLDFSQVQSVVDRWLYCRAAEGTLQYDHIRWSWRYRPCA